jgi:hypothetical protein
MSSVCLRLLRLGGHPLEHDQDMPMVMRAVHMDEQEASEAVKLKHRGLLSTVSVCPSPVATISILTRIYRAQYEDPASRRHI